MALDADGLQESFSAVLAEAEAQQAADAASVAAAVYAGVGLADRLRSALDITVVLQVAGATVVGAPAHVNAEAVELHGADNRRWVVRLAAIESVRGLPAGHRPASGVAEQRLGFAAALRPFAGEQVQVGLAGATSAGLLRRVGADHIELGTFDGTTAIAFHAIGWICGQ